MGKLANSFIDHPISWEGIGSIAILPVWGPNHVRMGYYVSINGEPDDRVWPFGSTRDAVEAAIRNWAGEWPPEPA